MHAFIRIGEDIFQFVTAQGNFAVLLLLFVEEMGVPLPIPGDLILLYAGYRVSTGQLNFLEILLFSTLGVVIGSSALFFLFRVAGRPFIKKHGKYFFLPPDRFHKLDKWFEKKGDSAVLIGRFIPGLRVFLSGIAGLSDLKYSHFLIQIVFASLIWTGLFTGLGYYLGEKWENFAAVIHQYSYIFFFIFIIGILFYFIKHMNKE